MTASRRSRTSTSHSRAIQGSRQPGGFGDRPGERAPEVRGRDRRPGRVDHGDGQAEGLAAGGQMRLVAEERVREHRHAVVDRLVGRVQPVVGHEEGGALQDAPLVDVVGDVDPGVPQARPEVRRQRVATQADERAGVLGGGDRLGEGGERAERLGDPVAPDHGPARRVHPERRRGRGVEAPGFPIAGARHLGRRQRPEEGDGLERLPRGRRQEGLGLAVEIEVPADAGEIGVGARVEHAPALT